MYFDKIESVSDNAFYPQSLLQEMNEFIHHHTDDQADVQVTIGEVNLSGEKLKTELKVRKSIDYGSSNIGTSAEKQDTTGITGSSVRGNEAFRSTIAQKATVIKDKIEHHRKIVHWEKMGIMFLIFVAVAGFLYSYLSKQETGPWEVRLIRGGYTIEGSDQGNNRISEHSIITSSHNSEVEVFIPAYARITMSENTTLRVENTWRDFLKVQLLRGKIMLRSTTDLSDIKIMAGEAEIVCKNSNGSVDRNGLGEIGIECHKGLVEVKKDKVYLLPFGYRSEIKESSIHLIPYFRGSNNGFIAMVGEINRGVINSQVVNSLISLSTKRDIYTLLQCIPFANDEQRADLYSKSLDYANQPKEIALKTALTLDDQDVQIWIQNLTENKAQIK